MRLSDITRNGIERALEEYDELGRDEFLFRYRYSPMNTYFLEHAGRRYPSKAIVGVAHRYDRPDEGHLQNSDFSGGQATVAKLLTDLQFKVVRGPLVLSPEGSTGEKLDASFDLDRDRDGWAINYHSRGGTKGSPSALNTQYTEGLQVLVRRLAHLEAELTLINVDSQPMHKLPPAQRRLSFRYPISLSQLSDIDALLSDISSKQKEIGHKGKPTGGNSTRRLRLCFTVDFTLEENDLLAHLALNQDSSACLSGDEAAVESVADSKATEGAVKLVTVNRYERNRFARKRCIETFGYRCSVCEIDFSERYGQVGRGFIHVHHLVPLSEIGERYEVDPVTDLRPVCPNCHAMLHHRTVVPRTIEELRRILNTPKPEPKGRSDRSGEVAP